MEDAAAYREASERFMFILNRALLVITSAKNARTAAWQVAYAMGVPCCEGVTMTERAKAIRVTRACLSKGAKQFQRANGLPPSAFMKSDEASASYAEARRKQLN